MLDRMPVLKDFLILIGILGSSFAYCLLVILWVIPKNYLPDFRDPDWCIDGFLILATVGMIFAVKSFRRCKW